jgi:hypothetical protein
MLQVHESQSLLIAEIQRRRVKGAAAPGSRQAIAILLNHSSQHVSANAAPYRRFWPLD